METRYSGPKHAVLNAQNDRLCLGFLMLITLFCMHKTTGEVRDLYRLAILLQKALFCMQKQEIRAGTHRDRYLRC